MKKIQLFNKKNKKELKEALSLESFNRITVSFYRYFYIANPKSFRDLLYLKWDSLNIFGRVYIATEGINSQISIPEHYWKKFLRQIGSINGLENVFINRAYQEGSSFYKLTIKVRKELVAYGISKNDYNINKVGNHLSAKDFNIAVANSDSVILDMRNYYESEIGRFDNAIIPDAETSKELLPEVKHLLQGKENKKVLLYCTGGIRCEKASAFLIKNGFKDVNQLHGGIINYANQIKKLGLESKFKGKNFVFDNRLGERVTKDILAQCHLCGVSCDDHTDCKNDACHILFIQCQRCSKDLNGCCSIDCKEFASLSKDKQKILRKDPNRVVSNTFFNSKIKPKINSKT